MITHVGRKGARAFHTPLEVVVHDADSAEYIVCSGTAPNTDWYRNITAQPVTSIQLRNQVWQADHRFLEPAEAAQ
jgi:deazaflavin-dependent oxidoreductase (nitroreductase family)